MLLYPGMKDNPESYDFRHGRLLLIPIRPESRQAESWYRREVAWVSSWFPRFSSFGKVTSVINVEDHGAHLFVGWREKS